MTKVKKSEAGTKPKYPPLTVHENRILNITGNRGMYLPGWQFDQTLKPHCVLIQSYYVGFVPGDSDADGKSIYVDLYGLEGRRGGETGEKIICTFFLRNRGLVYQFSDACDCEKYIILLRKEYAFEEWQINQEKKIHKEVTGGS